MKPNILFVSLPSLAFEYIQESLRGQSSAYQPLALPLGILYLSSSVKAWNDVGEVSILDYPLYLENLPEYANVEEFIITEAREQIKFKPDILAFSLIFSTSHPFFQLAVKDLKKLWPEANIIVGGTHATSCVDTLLSYKDVDYVLRGEGEIAFSEMMRQFSQGQPMRTKGLYSRGTMRDGDALMLAAPVENLDELPFPDWELLDIHAYIHARGRRRRAEKLDNHCIATIMTTRGCPFHCTYCSSHTVHGRKVRYRSTENVIQEIKILNSRYGVNLFIVEDDLFPANRYRVLALLDRIKALGSPEVELQFPSGLHINSLDEEIIDRMMQIGVHNMTLSIDAASEYTRKHIVKRNCDLGKARDLVQLCREKGIIVRCCFILGFPGETKALMDEAAQYMRSLGADWNVISIATPLIGSEMYEQFLNKGCFKEDVRLWSKAFFQERFFDTDEISADELKDFVYRLNLELNFLNNPNNRYGNFDRAISIFNDIIDAYPFHIFAWYGLHLAYAGIGDEEKAQECLAEIQKLITSDKRSAEQYSKYGDMLPFRKHSGAGKLAKRIIYETQEAMKILWYLFRDTDWTGPLSKKTCLYDSSITCDIKKENSCNSQDCPIFRERFENIIQKVKE